MSEAKRIIGTIANGLKDGDEFHFHYFDKPVGCQITQLEWRERQCKLHQHMDG